VARTDAPRGQTPILRAPLSSDHRSVISGVTGAGKLVTRVQDEAFRGPAIVDFLRQLLRQIPGTLQVIWDGAPIHRCRPVKQFLAAGAAARLWLEPLSAYAPELHPDEGVWNHLKGTNRRAGDEAEARQTPDVWLAANSTWSTVGSFGWHSRVWSGRNVQTA
jgi:transposase